VIVGRTLHGLRQVLPLKDIIKKNIGEHTIISREFWELDNVGAVSTCSGTAATIPHESPRIFQHILPKLVSATPNAMVRIETLSTNWLDSLGSIGQWDGLSANACIWHWFGTASNPPIPRSLAKGYSIKLVQRDYANECNQWGTTPRYACSRRVPSSPPLQQQSSFKLLICHNFITRFFFQNLLITGLYSIPRV
jgi:hypothetical protein